MATEGSEGEDDGKLIGGSKQLMLVDDLREMTKNAAWSVSSCKPGNGVQSLRDDNTETYWQSDGAQPHLVNIQLQRKVKLQLILLYVDFKLDESYTPSKISVRAGDGFHNMKEIKSVELVKPTGWVHISLSGTEPRGESMYHFLTLLYKRTADGSYPIEIIVSWPLGNEILGTGAAFIGVEQFRYCNILSSVSLNFRKLKGTKLHLNSCLIASEQLREIGFMPLSRETFVNTFMLQMVVLSNHLNGRDTHIRQIKVYGPRPNPIPRQPFQFSSTEFIMYSAVR